MIELTLAVIAVLGLSYQAYEIVVYDRCTACELIDIAACGDEGQTYDPLAGECVESRDLL